MKSQQMLLLMKQDGNFLRNIKTTTVLNTVITRGEYKMPDKNQIRLEILRKVMEKSQDKQVKEIFKRLETMIERVDSYGK